MRPYYSQIQVNVPSLLSLMIVSGRNYDLTWVKVLQSGLRKSSFVIMSWRTKKLKQWRTILDPYAWFRCNRFNARYSKFTEVIYKFSAKKQWGQNFWKINVEPLYQCFFFLFLLQVLMNLVKLWSSWLWHFLFCEIFPAVNL